MPKLTFRIVGGTGGGEMRLAAEVWGQVSGGCGWFKRDSLCG